MQLRLGGDVAAAPAVQVRHARVDTKAVTSQMLVEVADMCLHGAQSDVTTAMGQLGWHIGNTGF